MKTMIKTKPLAAAACGLLALTGMTAHAQLLSSETFSGYTPGTLLRDSAPSPTTAGYTGNWTAIDYGGGGAGTIAGALSYGGAGYNNDGVNHVGVAGDAGGIQFGSSGRTYRVLDSSTAVTSSTVGTLYLSFLFQSGQEYGGTAYQMLDLYNGGTADNQRTFTAGLTQNGGNSGSVYDFGVNEAYSNLGVAADTAVHLFVVGFNLSATAASDTVTVWLDPTLGAGAPGGGSTVSGQNIAFDRLSLSDYSGNSANWGNIRFGTTFDAVTIPPVPEPSTLALLGLGGLAVLLRRKQGRA
jgi:hypothetical protein